MNMASKFDTLRTLFSIVPADKLKVVANKASISKSHIQHLTFI